MKKLKHETYTDGVLEYGSVESRFNANRKKIGEDFIPKGRLFYTQMSARDSDIMQASNMGYAIDLKLKIPYRAEVSSKNKVRIDKDVYDIKKFDYTKEHIFLYLQRVGV